MDRKLLLHAFDSLPCLVIDCANAANPHALFPDAPLEKFNSVYIIEVEMLYKFRDVLKRLFGMAKKTGAETVIITSFRHLFNYQDEIENANIYEQCWRIMKKAGTKCRIIVSVHQSQEKMARKYCDFLG
ncbi:hypothetical protein J4227_04655 [Candidatus Woesearchaeota archaeon]|nr:hypothetical protein [Candidatus Woesearchaeota archaeon]